MRLFSLVSICAATALTLALTQCALPADLNGNNVLEKMTTQSDLGTVESNSLQPLDIMIRSDHGGDLYVANRDILQQMGADRDGQRLFFDYTTRQQALATDHHIVVLEKVEKIVTRPVEPSNQPDNLSSERPVSIVTANLSNDYLTLLLDFCGESYPPAAAVCLYPDGPRQYRLVVSDIPSDGGGEVMPNGYVSFALSKKDQALLRHAKTVYIFYCNSKRNVRRYELKCY